MGKVEAPSTAQTLPKQSAASGAVVPVAVARAGDRASSAKPVAAGSSAGAPTIARPPPAPVAGLTAAASKGLAAGMSFGSFGAAASAAATGVSGAWAGSAAPTAAAAGGSAAAAVSRAVSATAASAATEIVAASAAVSDEARKRAILGPFERASLTPAEQRYVAVDCEMVGTGPDGAHSALAQVVAVDYAGRVIYCKYVKVRERITDYRTAVSGIKPEHLSDPAYGAVDFDAAQREIATLLKGRILVGHGLTNDLRALMLGHSWREIRDTARYAPFCYRNREGKTRPRRLKHLAATHLGCVIQEGEHDPAEDARAALALFRKFRREWESSFTGGGGAGSSGSGGAGASSGGGAAGAAGKGKGGARSRSRSPGPAHAAASAAGAGDSAAAGAAAGGAASDAAAPLGSALAPRPGKPLLIKNAKSWKGKRLQAQVAARAAARAAAAASGAAESAAVAAAADGGDHDE